MKMRLFLNVFDMKDLYINITGFTPSTKTAWAVENSGKSCSYKRC